ncbi:MAG: winged helix-turn-helix transcriptional regulator [Burkholderiaceae bacterium]
MCRPDQASRIRYDEGCLAAHALNQIGDRWALLVVRELMFAPKRFQMIRAGLPGVTASVLTGRLAQLQDVGVVVRNEAAGVYSLTAVGHGLLPVLEALCRWALTIPEHDPARFISPSALMISMGVNLIRSRAERYTAVAGFDFGTEAFRVDVADGQLTAKAAKWPDAPFVLQADGNSMAIALYGKTPLGTLLAQGVIDAQGNLGAAQAFVDLFALQTQSRGRKTT